MKIKITEIEASAQDLRSSNSVADGILNILRNAFSPDMYECEDESEGESDE